LLFVAAATNANVDIDVARTEIAPEDTQGRIVDEMKVDAEVLSRGDKKDNLRRKVSSEWYEHDTYEPATSYATEEVSSTDSPKPHDYWYGKGKGCSSPNWYGKGKGKGYDTWYGKGKGKGKGTYGTSELVETEPPNGKGKGKGYNTWYGKGKGYGDW